jgi:hypothetical protein
MPILLVACQTNIVRSHKSMSNETLGKEHSAHGRIEILQNWGGEPKELAIMTLSRVELS